MNTSLDRYILYFFYSKMNWNFFTKDIKSKKNEKWYVSSIQELVGKSGLFASSFGTGYYFGHAYGKN